MKRSRITRTLLQFSVITLIILGCGKAATGPGDPARPPEPTPTPTPHVGDGPTYTLRLFGAPWCTNCKSDFPKINEALKTELTRDGARLKGEVYVTTGDTASQKPTQEIATAYRDFLKLDFAPFADEWPWKKFREQVQQDRKLPAAVVTDADGKVLKVFNPGPTTFVVEEIVAFVQEKLK